MSTSHSYVSLAATFRTGKASPVDVLEAGLAQVDALEGEVRAFVHMDRDAALAAARESATRWRDGRPLSPVDGMAIGVKDIIETADFPTGQGSSMWRDFATLRDAASVQALREAGVIVLGKTTTTEFASTEQFSPTTNPHDAARTPGGSSSGSAAAVGAGMVPAALGSQVVGSTLRPASFCGCVGYKPSVGALNRGGSYDYLSQSCVGVIAARLDDVWALSMAIASRVGGDPGHPGLDGPTDLPAAHAPKRLAVLETAGWPAATAGAKAAFEARLKGLEAAGVEVVRRRDDPALDDLEGLIADALDLTWRIMSWEFRWPLATYVRRDAAAVSVAMRGRLADAEAMTPLHYREALARRERVRAAYDAVASRHDGIVALAATGAAPVGLDWTGDPSMNVPASLLGAPAVSLPLLADEGLPLGLQLIGARNRDADLMSVAAWAVDAQ